MSYLNQFYHHIFGQTDGPQLVFLHGLMGSGANWRKVTPAFEQHYHILIYDQRGHGRSFQPASGYAPENYAEDLRQILDELGWSQVYLVGHSMGGRAAMTFSALWPHRVKKLVIEDIGPNADQEAADRIERLLNLVPTPFVDRAQAREFFKTEFPKRLKGHSQAPVLAEFFYANLYELDSKVDWRFNKAGILASLREGRARDRWTEFSSLQMPTLVVRGAESQDLPRPVFERMLALNPKARGVEIPGAGHWIHFERVNEFVGVICEFFADPD